MNRNAIGVFDSGMGGRQAAASEMPPNAAAPQGLAYFNEYLL